MGESNYELSSFTGSHRKVGQTTFGKYFDETTQKWERWSGSGAPYVITVKSLSLTDPSQVFNEDIDKIDYTYVAGLVETVKYYSITGSNLLFTLTYTYSGSYVTSVART